MYPMICVPVYDGRTHFQFNRSLHESFIDMVKHNHAFLVEYEAGCCYLDLARNQLVDRFLKSECTDLFFIDADVGWQADAIRKLCEVEGDIVAAPYRYKVDEEKFPFFPIADAKPNEQGLIEASGLATGFMRIRRNALEKMRQHYQHRVIRRTYPDGSFEFIPHLFACETDDNGIWWGEDLRFCNLARAAGLRLWIYPGLELSHTGLKEFRGVYQCAAS